MGCLLSVSGKGCTALLDINDLEDLVLCRRGFRRGMVSAGSSSLYRQQSCFSSSTRRKKAGTRKGTLVTDALRNLEKTNNFRHGECYFCHYKNKTCSGICIHREIFTSVKPELYSTTYEEEKGRADNEKDDSKEKDGLETGRMGVESWKMTKHFGPESSKRFKRKCKKPIHSIHHYQTGSSSFKRKAQLRKLHSVSAFPRDIPQYGLGIRPQFSYRLPSDKNKGSVRDARGASRSPPVDDLESVEDGSEGSPKIKSSKEKHYLHHSSTCSSQTPASCAFSDSPYEEISSPPMRKAPLRASDFGLVKNKSKSLGFPLQNRRSLPLQGTKKSGGLFEPNPFAVFTKKPLSKFATGSEPLRDSRSNQEVSFRTKKFETKSIYLPDFSGESRLVRKTVNYHSAYAIVFLYTIAPINFNTITNKILTI